MSSLLCGMGDLGGGGGIPIVFQVGKFIDHKKTMGINTSHRGTYMPFAGIADTQEMSGKVPVEPSPTTSSVVNRYRKEAESVLLTLC